MTKCYICGRPTHDEPPIDDALDCGGDCLRCMAEVARDPDCIRTMRELEPTNPQWVEEC